MTPIRALITGAGGMIGSRLAARIASEGTLLGRPVELVLADIADPPEPAGALKVTTMAGDFSAPGAGATLAAYRPDVVFHLAAIVSGEAEANFDLGWKVNADGTRGLLDGLRTEHSASGGTYVPRVVAASSIAVFGGPYPDQIDDDFLTSPQTSYGAQKAYGELLLQDYSRKGYIDGLSLRLPTICVRPGKPNKAASSFFSGIIREPLNGQEAILPVASTVRHWHASPRSAVGFFLHAAALDTARLEGRRALNLPGVSCTVAEQIEALERCAGPTAAALVRHQLDETIARIVAGWPRNFTATRARALGFTAESDFDEIIRVYLEDESIELA